MNITLKNSEIINSINAIQKIMEIKLPPRTSWNLTKNLKRLIEAFRDYDETEKKLIDEYFEKDKDGKYVPANEECTLFKIIKGKEQEYYNRKNELLNLTDEINIHMIKLSDFEGEGINFEGKYFYAIEYMIDENE